MRCSIFHKKECIFIEKEGKEKRIDKNQKND